MNKKEKLRNNTQKKKSLIQIIKGENKQKGQKKSKNNYAIDYYNQILLSPFRQKSKTAYKTKNYNNKFEINNKQNNFYPSDILLMNNYNNFPYQKKSDIMELKQIKQIKGKSLNNRYEKLKLKNIVSMLKIQQRENNEIILNNQKEIENLKKRVSLMSIQMKKIFDSQN